MLQAFLCPVRVVSQFLRCFSIFLLVEFCPNRSEWRRRSRRTTAAAAAGEERWRSTLEIGRRGFTATFSSQAAACPLQGNAPNQIDLGIVQFRGKGKDESTTGRTHSNAFQEEREDWRKRKKEPFTLPAHFNFLLTYKSPLLATWCSHSDPG